MPKTLALIDDDRDFTEFLSQHLRETGMHVDVFDDSNDLVTDPAAFGYDFYVVDLMLPGVDGLTLIKLLRRRTSAGVLVVSGQLAPGDFKQVINAGADMYLTKPVQFEQIDLVIQAVQRRIQSALRTELAWGLDRQARQLVSPAGVRADLTEVDVAVLECFVRAEGGTVTREALLAALSGVSGSSTSVDLGATIYRLRRRIGRVAPDALPLQSKSKIGYVFNAPIKAL